MAQTDSKLLIFDCDSTLSSIEGIDELGRSKGEAVFRAVEQMTHDAMDGKIAIQEVFGRRLDIIQPRKSDVDAVARQYLATLEPTALATVTTLVAKGWLPLILSGGFRPAILPLAAHLGISRVEAVDLFFTDEGAYAGFDRAYPTTRSGGKPEVIRQLRHDYQPARVVMVGDGVSDLETKSDVDLFIGFGRYVQRAKVKAGAHHFIDSLDQLLGIL